MQESHSFISLMVNTVHDVITIDIVREKQTGMDYAIASFNAMNALH